MTRAVRFTLTASAVLLVCACRSDTLTPSLGHPLASFADGAHAGNPDFFFLSPIFKDPSSNPNFSAGQFNANLRPTVEVCQLAPLVAPATVRLCGATFKTFAAADVTLDRTGELYQVNWDTKSPALDVNKEYRIRVLLGPNTELGYADIDPVSTGAGLKRVDTGEYIGLVDGRTLPIKFRIENGAACLGGDCDTKTIDLSQGGNVILTSTGDRVDIPAQTNGQPVNVTVQQCPDLNIALPLFGRCLRVTADPPLTTALVPPATVSLCSLDPLTLPANHAQSELVTLHRKDAELVVALPHSTDFCGGTIGRSHVDAPRNLAERGWRTLRRAADWLFKPAELHASALVFDVGAGGQTSGFSDFQFALPAKMEIVGAAAQDVLANTNAPAVPTVYVTDANNQPVAGARVQFLVTSAGGTITPAGGLVVSNSDGYAALTSWHVGNPDQYTVDASGFGIADPANNGPGEGFDPFAPAVFPGHADEDEAQTPVTLGLGTLHFSATSLAQLAGYQVVATDVIPLAAGTGFIRETADCPVGSVVLGGGAAVVGEGTADFHTKLQESAPGTVNGGAQDVWLVSIKNEDVGPHNIRIFAVCATRPAGYEVVTSDVALAPSGGFNRQSVICPTGKSVLGGGVAVIGEGTGDFDTKLQESAPGTINGGAQDVWAVAVKNEDGTSHTVRVAGICVPRPFGYEKIASGNIGLAAAGGFDRESILCPVGKSILAGGASVIGEGSADFDTRMQESAPGTIGGGAQDVWLASLKNDDVSGHTMSIRASCATVLRAP